ncbi:hypothetical protein XENORESO_018655 [Xenotaenia resolanae]|uniref:Uncharacterized protein n=1 Tax=Xenotaenia resolanae TaxID=208358 RepID=A0ABV0VME1_9TELE
MWPGNPLGRAEVRINLTFTQTSQLLCNKCSYVEPAGIPGAGRETKHLLSRHIPPLACKCSGDDQQEGVERKVEAIVRSEGSPPQKDKSNLNFLSQSIGGYPKNVTVKDKQ